MIVVGVVALILGVVIGTVLGHTLATAPTMPSCALCGNDLPECTCYGQPKR